VSDLTFSSSTPSAADLASTMARAAAGDNAAWGTLVDRYGPLVWAVARAYRLTQADANDVVQTTWLQLLENLDDIEPAALTRWLTTTARREALRVRRSMREVTEVLEVVDQEFLVAPDDPAATYERRGHDEQLWRAFAQLPQRCQQLLRLLIAGSGTTPYSEVSAALGMPVGSLGPTRARCLARLRQLLAGVADPEDLDASDADLVGLLRGSHAIADPVTSDVLEESRRLPETARRTDPP